MTDIEAKQFMCAVLLAYPSASAKWTLESLEFYEAQIRPLPAELARRGLSKIVRSAREFPPPAGLILRECALIELKDRGVIATAEEAWEAVGAAIVKRGYYQGPGPLTDHPLIGRTIDAIGWLRICTNENIEASRAHFMRVYNSLLERALEDAVDDLCEGRPLQIDSISRCQIANLADSMPLAAELGEKKGIK